MATTVPIDFAAVIGAVSDLAKGLGVFDRVNGFAPTNAPGDGITLGLYFGTLVPAPRRSGLNVTSAAFLLNGIVLGSDRYNPREGQDPRLLHAASTLFAALIGDIDASGPTGTSPIDEIDIFGIGGLGQMRMQGDFVKLDDGDYRAIDLFIPVLLDDVYPQDR